MHTLHDFALTDATLNDSISWQANALHSNVPLLQALRAPSAAFEEMLCI